MIIFKSEVGRIIEKNPREKVIQRAEIENKSVIDDGYDLNIQMRGYRDPQQRL